MAVQLPSPTEWRELKEFKEPFCLTIYAPHIDFDPNGATNPNQIELKNMLEQAEVALLNDGMSPRDVDKTLAPARGLLATHEFFTLRGESLALFSHPKLFRYYHLPGDIPYLLSIGRGFSLEPMELAVGDNRSYLVLVLSHNNVKLYEGDRFTIRELKLKNFPAHFAQAIRLDEYPKAKQSRMASPASNRRSSEITHSPYSESQTDKDMLLDYFHLVDRSLRKLLQKKNLPVILAGVEYLLPIYRQANTSPYLLPKVLTGNIDRERPDEIRRRAWRLIKEMEGGA